MLELENQAIISNCIHAVATNFEPCCAGPNHLVRAYQEELDQVSKITKKLLYRRYTTILKRNFRG